MKDKYLYYSVLRYMPSRLGGEVLNLGVLIYDEANNKVSFPHISKYSRLKAFDDEINCKDIQNLLETIEQDVLAKANEKEFDIEKYVEFYINSIIFDKPKKIYTENYDATQKMIEGMYLRFDKDKIA